MVWRPVCQVGETDGLAAAPIPKEGTGSEKTMRDPTPREEGEEIGAQGRAIVQTCGVRAWGPGRRDHDILRRDPKSCLWPRARLYERSRSFACNVIARQPNFVCLISPVQYFSGSLLSGCSFDASRTILS